MNRMTKAVTPLRRARLESGMLQVTLAERTDRSQAFISRVENGSLRGTPEFYERAARALGRPVADLAPRDEPDKSDEE